MNVSLLDFLCGLLSDYRCKTFSGGRRLVTIPGLGTSDGYIFGKAYANDMMV